MRQVSQKELERLKKKGGVKVRRKFGTKSKTPESVATESKALSGAEPTERPVPVSNNGDLVPLLSKITEVLSRLEARDVPKRESTILADAKQATAAAAQVAVIEPGESISLPPMSIEPAPSVRKPKKAKSNWNHVLKRDESGSMGQLISTDQFGNTWTHTMVRIKKLIDKVMSKSNSGLEFLLQIHRNKQTQLIENVTQE